MAITARQQKFIDAYLLSGNATSAAIAAGYAEKSAGVEGHRLLKNANIAAEVAKRQQKAADRADLTLTEHLAKLAELRDLASGKDQYSAATSAEISRGKASGFYVERKEHTGKNGGPIEVRVRVTREGKRVTAA